MHDIDRTLQEVEAETLEEAFPDSEASLAEESQEEGDPEGEEFGVAEESSSSEGPFDENEETELASELLMASDDRELDLFLTKLFSRAVGTVRGFLRSGVGRILKRAIGSIAKRALPVAGATLGNMFAPGIGRIVGGKLASSAGRLLGLEMEGLAPEDQEYTVAKQLVRLAGDAAREAAQEQPIEGQLPIRVARRALIHSARRHAPGLLRLPIAPLYDGGGAAEQTGQWVRYGDRIIVQGV